MVVIVTGFIVVLQKTGISLRVDITHRQAAADVDHAGRQSHFPCGIDKTAELSKGLRATLESITAEVKMKAFEVEIVGMLGQVLQALQEVIRPHSKSARRAALRSVTQ